MKAVIVLTSIKKSQIKPHNICKFQQVCTTVQISIARLHLTQDSIIRSKALILTWTDFQYIGGTQKNLGKNRYF